MRPALQPLPELAKPAKAKFAENVAGRFSVNTECIDCDLCRQVAPAHFVRETNHGHSYVQRQPKNEPEIQRCREALATCPVDAIADEGG